jgi:hypothetical protein
MIKGLVCKRKKRLLGDTRGVSMLEFALSLPILLTFILGGMELANYIIVRQQISQLALQVADNASRIGAQNVLKNKPIYEGDINDLFTGAKLQGGSLNLDRFGRIVLSSLEVNAQNGQWIHWQRCSGSLGFSSAYGPEGTGAVGTSLPGMGPQGNRIQATALTPAVMFVEIAYRYQPIVSARWLMAPPVINEIATMTVRDDRDLTQIKPSAGQMPSICL